MAKPDPLHTVLKLASEAEDQAALQLKSARLDLQKSQAQLSALQNYRLDYMKQMEGQQGQQISASYYHQFHQFVRQIDDAITKQHLGVAEANKQVTYRQNHWQEKQQKRKAVELLLEKKAMQAATKAHKAEQKMFDEFASQQYFRQSRR
ncbi:flagellar export protein FliJ [Shewanella sp. Scap07]|uniref:flagellar export protein FliJ n=1 Tax=Shewanella sp. Scap07 TaxID=2589987 RepID=UPI0015BED980|nr:flagellar export protein FliJ [Shewanella sp. Scap07]QLE86149.1 flagellar export protein FliJ [Shewanella sp. Scap07]